MDDFERRLILDALQTTGGRQTDAARALGVLPSTLNEKMKRLGLRERDSFALREDLDALDAGAPTGACIGPDTYGSAKLARREVRSGMGILEAMRTVFPFGLLDAVNSIVLGDCAEDEGRRLSVAIRWKGAALCVVRMVLDGPRVFEETVLRTRAVRRVLHLMGRLVNQADFRTLSVHFGEWSFKAGVRQGLVEELGPLRYRSPNGLARHIPSASDRILRSRQATGKS